MDDEEGIDVSILSLYKFLVGHKKPKLGQLGVGDEQEMVLKVTKCQVLEQAH